MNTCNNTARKWSQLVFIYLTLVSTPLKEILTNFRSGSGFTDSRPNFCFIAVAIFAFNFIASTFFLQNRLNWYFYNATILPKKDASKWMLSSFPQLKAVLYPKKDFIGISWYELFPEKKTINSDKSCLKLDQGKVKTKLEKTLECLTFTFRLPFLSFTWKQWERQRVPIFLVWTI